MNSFSDHPNPQFERADWQSLNGEWDFGFMKARRGFTFSAGKAFAEKIRSKNDFPYTIHVPFCLESELSGIGHTGFVNAVWYRKK